jgi:dolichyl-phosphate-mannose-protein mannosyltransferase
MSGLTLAGGLLRLAGFNRPPHPVFDEFFYARDGCWYVKASRSACGLVGLVTSDRDADRWLREFGELTPEHPPLGKWLIGAGIRLTKFSPTGWRIASVVAGTLTIALVYFLARAIAGSTGPAAVASGLLALDFLHLVQSRLAMLEIFVALFAVAAFLCCAYERDRIARLGPEGEGRPNRSWWGRAWTYRWRAGAGLAGGAAAASKASGWLVVGGVALLVGSWELGRARAAGRRTVLTAAKEAGPSLALCLVVIPVAVYAMSYAGRIDGSLLSWPWADGSWIEALIERQRYLFDFHGAAVGRGTSSSWLPMLAPPGIYTRTASAGTERIILVFGNPIVWWAGFAAVAYLAVEVFRRRSFGGPDLVVVAGFASTYASWLLLTRARPDVFLYYFTPAVPFLCVGLGCAVRRITSSVGGRAAVGGFVAFAVLAFAFYYPALTSRPMSPADIRARVQLADLLTVR